MKNSVSKIVGAGLLVGTIDILSAFAWYFIKSGKTKFLNIFKFIASGIFGKQALSGGTAMILAGLFLHYFIAFAFTFFFFLIFPKIRLLSVNKIATAIVYGLFIWSVMNLIVVPLSGVPARPFSFSNGLINILILIIGIGFPLTYIAAAYYKKPVG